jgi:hypothetical protein
MIKVLVLFLIIYYIESFVIYSDNNLNNLKYNNIKINYFDDNNLMDKIFKKIIIKNTIHLNQVNSKKVNNLINCLSKYSDKDAIKLFYYRYDINDLQIIRNYKILSEMTCMSNNIIQLKLNKLLFYLRDELYIDNLY